MNFAADLDSAATHHALQMASAVPSAVPLVDAMFVNFPGNSGETLRISIAPENQRVQRTD